MQLKKSVRDECNRGLVGCQNVKWGKEYAKGPKGKRPNLMNPKKIPHPNIFSLQQQQHFSIAAPLSHALWANNNNISVYQKKKTTNISEFRFLNSLTNHYIYIYILRQTKPSQRQALLSLSLCLSLDLSLWVKLEAPIVTMGNLFVSFTSIFFFYSYSYC